MESPLANCYERHRSLVYRTTRHFQRTHGGEWRLLVSEAHWYWLHAVRTWDPQRQPLGKRIRYVIWHGLLEMWRTQKRHARLLPMEKNAEEDTVELDKLVSKDSHRWQRLLVELSDDARTIVELVIGPHLDSLLPQRMRKRQAMISTKQDAIVAFLLDVGWTGKEILRCFQEIKEVLS